MFSTYSTKCSKHNVPYEKWQWIKKFTPADVLGKFNDEADELIFKAQTIQKFSKGINDRCELSLLVEIMEGASKQIKEASDVVYIIRINRCKQHLKLSNSC
jgi:hypothetical protein